MDRQDLRGLVDAIWPFVPPAIGAYFGLRYAEQQSKGERITTFACAAFLSLYLGEAIGEYWELGRKSTAGVTIIVALLLSDLTGAAIAVVRQWHTDPAGTLRKLLNVWRGRGGGQ